MIQAIGIDFGTTNSVVALLHDDGSVATQRHADARRVPLGALLLDRGDRRPPRAPPGSRPGGDLRLPGGPARQPADHVDEDLPRAEELFRDPHLRPPLHPGTPDRPLPSRTPRRQPHAASRVIVGRPVRFAGELVDDALGAERLRGAYAEAGCADISLALEPEAAGTRFARTLTEPATVLIGDFGGGTSDFSVMRFDPRTRLHAARPRRHRHCRRRVRLPHHRPRHRAAARQGRHLPGDGQAAARCRPSTTPASPAGTCCR